VTNVGATPCTVWDGVVTGDDVFSLAKPRPLVRVAPGDAFFVPVAFRPTQSGRHAATVTFQTSRPGMPVLEVPVTGGSLDGCLSAEPAFLDFGRRRLDCGPRELPARFANRCPGDVDVSSLVVGDSPEPGVVTLAGHSALPAKVAPGEAVDAVVRFTPGAEGFLAAPLFALASDVPWPWLVAVTGESVPPAEHRQQWVQPAPGKLDLLWVLDNTASMADERTGLRRGAEALLARLDAAGVDWTLGVTTTGVGPAPSGSAPCPGGADGGESGRLFPVDRSMPRLLTPATPGRSAALLRLMEVGGCHAIEQGLEGAVRALTPPLVDQADDPRTAAPNDGNLGLRRADAALAVMVFSDEDDESPREVPLLTDLLERSAGGAPFAFGAAVAPEAGCATAVEPGRRYLEAVARTRGASANVCDADLTPLADMATGLLEPRRLFRLQAPADPATLVVQVDGASAGGWSYEVATASLLFTTAPPAGARVEAAYLEPCP
jgi:hypothetical protein